MITRNINDDNTLAFLFRRFTHPVGSVYITSSNEDPAKALGGKWKKLDDSFAIANGTYYAWERIS